MCSRKSSACPWLDSGGRGDLGQTQTQQAGHQPWGQGTVRPRGRRTLFLGTESRPLPGHVGCTLRPPSPRSPPPGPGEAALLWARVCTPTASQSRRPVPLCSASQNLCLPGDELAHCPQDCWGEKATSHQKPSPGSLLSLDTEPQDGTMPAPFLITASLTKCIYWHTSGKISCRKLSAEAPAREDSKLHREITVLIF